MQTLCTSVLPFFLNSKVHRSDLNEEIFRFAALLSVLLLALPGLTRAQSTSPTPIQASDLFRLRTVQEVTISPDGRHAAYTVRRVVPPSRPSVGSDADHRRQLYVVPATGGEAPHLLTRPTQDARQPAWHPDGALLAFVRSVQGTPQVFIVSMNGGEPYQLTHTPHGAQHPQWSPDGEHLLFASEVPQPAVQRQTGRPAPTERPGRTSQDVEASLPPDTLLVLRHAQTLDPVDTLAFGPNRQLRLRTDTSRSLRTPDAPVSERLAQQPVDSLAALSTDSLRAVFDSLRVLPDTTTVPVTPDTAASPDGRLLQMRRWMNQRRQDRGVRVFTRLDLQNERRLAPTPTYRHHFVVEVPSDLRTGDPSPPTPRPVTHGYRSYGQTAWLPGGNQLVVSGTPPTAHHPDRVQKRNLYVVDVHGTRSERLLDIENYALTAPALTSDGTTVAFRAQPLSDTAYSQAELGLFAVDGRSEPRFITSEFDRDVGSLHWSPDRWYLYATGSSRGGAAIYRFSPFSPDTADASPSMTSDRASSRDTFALDSTMVSPAPYEQMTDETQTVHSFDVTDATAAYATTQPSSPSELYTNTISFQNEQPLSSHNTDWLDDRRLSISESLTIVRDSLPVHGRVTSPAPFVDSLRYPMLVQVRGGPPPLNTADTPETWFERQFLAAHGFGIVEVWPRGSAGYGADLRRASFQDWGAGPAQDVLAVADSAAALAWTDSTRQALAGASFGASLTAWILSQTDRFEAAVALNGAYDLPAMLGEGRAWRLIPKEFGGFPWEDESSPPVADSLRATGALLSSADTTRLPSDSTLLSSDTTASPSSTLQHSSSLSHAHQIETPLLLLQGGADRRVGPSQSERLYKRLKILNRPVEYVRYPRVGHDVTATATPEQQQDLLVRFYEFLARFIEPGGRPPETGQAEEP